MSIPSLLMTTKKVTVHTKCNLLLYCPCLQFYDNFGLNQNVYKFWIRYIGSEYFAKTNDVGSDLGANLIFKQTEICLIRFWGETAFLKMLPTYSNVLTSSVVCKL